MFQLTISEKGGRSKTRGFDKEVTIGRVQGNDIILPRGNVSKKHARIVERDGRLVVLDLKSTNGTFVNGKRIATPQVIRLADQVQIGDFFIQIADPEAAEEPVERKSARRQAPGRARRSSVIVEENDPDDDFEEDPAQGVDDYAEDFEDTSGGHRLQAEPEAVDEFDEAPEPVRPAERKKPAKASPEAASQPDPEMAGRDPLIEKYAELQREVHNRLIEYLDLRRLDIERLADEELWNQTERAIRDIIVQMENDGEIPDFANEEKLVNDVLNEALGLGPLEEYLADPAITEVMVNHSKQIYVERDGRLNLANKVFSSDMAVLGVIERIVAPLGRRIDESSPMVDARLKDGSRVNAIIPPLAIKGPSITIRKFKKEAITVEQLIRWGTLTAGMAEFLEMCVEARRNVVVSGGTGSGKTTTLNCLSSYIPVGERIVTVEDAAELKIKQSHWVSLETRPPNIEGTGEVTIRDLVRNCLRMRPDRIVVGECRGGEALDMLQAMNTGHDGSLTTVHANSPRDALSRLETLVLMAGMELPVRAIREQIASAVDIIVQQTRFSDGSRKVTHISEVTGMESEIITLQDIFYFKQEGFTADNRVAGRYVATGFVPKFYDDLQRRGIPVNMDIFREQ